MTRRVTTMPPRRGGAVHLDFLPILPRDRSVGIGCIGSGFIMADCHLVAYRHHGLNPVAITSRKLAHAQRIADRHDLPRVYRHYTRLLEDPDVQVLDIAVPPDVQYQVIRDAVKHSRARGGSIRGILAQK